MPTAYTFAIMAGENLKIFHLRSYSSDVPLSMQSFMGVLDDFRYGLSD